MKVVILCGGQGTRLREETEFKPKPMVEVGGKPILWHIMKLYAHFGFDDFVLCLGYKGDVIRDYFLNFAFRNRDFTVDLGQHNSVQIHQNKEEEIRWRVTLAETGAESMTGSRLKKVARHLDGGPFMLTYGDGLCNANLQDLVSFHKSQGKLATVTAVHPGQSRFGELLTENGQVTTFREKPEVSQGSLISGGFFVFEPGFLDFVTEAEDCVLETTPMHRLVEAGQLSAYRHEGFWASMDTFRDTQALNKIWTEGAAPWKVWP